MDSAEENVWERPKLPKVAHFDLFSGAAGDMMLAACIDAGKELFPEKYLFGRCTHRLKMGIPSIAHEFDVKYERVHRGKGSLAALHVNVHSIYQHQAAPVPRENSNHDHSHAHTGSSSHSHTHSHDISHTHDHVHDGTRPEGDHQHSHDHGAQDSASYSSGPLRNYPEIRDMIANAPDEYIPPWVKKIGISAFHALATAEAHVHGVSSIEQVHFHEVGAVDSIADTLLTLLALYELNVTSLTFSPLPLGYGTVQTDHGLLPVPAPAVLFLMRNRPVVAGPAGWTGELVTPTAAALICALDDDMNPKSTGRRPPRFTLRAVGVGAGTKDFANHPNVLRLLIGEITDEA